MAKPLNITIPNFSGGLQSPDIYPQTDLEKQKAGLKVCSNMIVHARGSVSNRPGTGYIADTAQLAAVSQLARLVPFSFNAEQNYMLEFTHAKMRVLKDGELVYSAGAPYVLATDINAADIQTFGFEQSADTLYIFQHNAKRQKITRTADDAWTYASITDVDGPYLKREDDDSDVTVTVTYSGSGAIWNVESSSAIFGNVGNGEPIRLGFVKPGDGSEIFWNYFTVASLVTDSSITVNDLGNDIGYQHMLNGEFKNGTEFWEDRSDENSTLTYDVDNQRSVLTDGATGFARMMQAVIVKQYVNYRLVTDFADIEGVSQVRVGTTVLGDELYNSGALGTGAVIDTADFKTTAELIYITINTNGSADTDITTVNDVSLKEYEVGAANPTFATNDWRLAAFNDTYGYPQLGVIHEDSMYLARTTAFPQTIWKSELGEFEKFGFNTPGRSTDSFDFKPSTPQINGIEWLKLYNGLNVGTADAVWRVTSSTGAAITSTDINLQVNSNVGTLKLAPLVAGNSLIITPRGMEAVSELTSSFEASGFVPRDLSLLADDLFKNRRIIHWAFARNPDSVIWCVLDNGVLLGLTYLREYDIWAWHTHSTPLGEGFKDVATIPNSSDDNIDDVYFVVNRAETGATTNYYLEKLNTRITPQTAAYGLSASGTPYDYKFLDSAITAGFPTAYISAVTKADPAVVTTTAAHGKENGALILINNVKGMTELNGNEYRVANKAPATFELVDTATGANIDSSAFTVYVSDGTVIEQIPTITAATQADPVEITANSHNRSNGDLVMITNVAGGSRVLEDETIIKWGMTELNNNVYKVASVTATTFELTDEYDVDIDGTAFTTYLAGGEVREMVTAISELDHLEGSTVSVLADGRVETGHVVTSGAITLDDAASFVHVGLPYVSEIKTHDIDAFLSSGNTQNKLKSIIKSGVYFKDTLSGKGGSEDDYLNDFVYWQEVDWGEVPALYTGFLPIRHETSPNVAQNVIVKQVDPYPMTISRIIATTDFSEG